MDMAPPCALSDIFQGASVEPLISQTCLKGHPVSEFLHQFPLPGRGPGLLNLLPHSHAPGLSAQLPGIANGHALHNGPPPAQPALLQQPAQSVYAVPTPPPPLIHSVAPSTALTAPHSEPATVMRLPTASARTNQEAGISFHLLKLLLVERSMVLCMLDAQRALRLPPSTGSTEELLEGVWVAVRTPSGKPVVRPVFAAITQPGGTHLCLIPQALKSSQVQQAVDELVIQQTPPVRVPSTHLLGWSDIQHCVADVLGELCTWWLYTQHPPLAQEQVHKALSNVLWSGRAYKAACTELSEMQLTNSLTMFLVMLKNHGRDGLEPPSLDHLPAWDRTAHLQLAHQWMQRQALADPKPPRAPDLGRGKDSRGPGSSSSPSQPKGSDAPSKPSPGSRADKSSHRDTRTSSPSGRSRDGDKSRRSERERDRDRRRSRSPRGRSRSRSPRRRRSRSPRRRSRSPATRRRSPSPTRKRDLPRSPERASGGRSNTKPSEPQAKKHKSEPTLPVPSATQPAAPVMASGPASLPSAVPVPSTALTCSLPVEFSPPGIPPPPPSAPPPPSVVCQSLPPLPTESPPPEALPPHLRPPPPPAQLDLGDLEPVPEVHIAAVPHMSPREESLPSLPDTEVAAVLAQVAAEVPPDAPAGLPCPSAVLPDVLSDDELEQFKSARFGEKFITGFLRFTQGALLHHLQSIYPSGLSLQDLEPDGQLPVAQQLITELGSPQAVVTCPTSKKLFEVKGHCVFLRDGYALHIRKYLKTLADMQQLQEPPPQEQLLGPPTQVSEPLAVLAHPGPFPPPTQSAQALPPAAALPFAAGMGGPVQQPVILQHRLPQLPAATQQLVVAPVPVPPSAAAGSTHPAAGAPSYSFPGQYSKRPLPRYCDALCRFLGPRGDAQATEAETLAAHPYPSNYIAQEVFLETNRDLFEVLESPTVPGDRIYRLQPAGVMRALELKAQDLRATQDSPLPGSESSDPSGSGPASGPNSQGAQIKPAGGRNHRLHTGTGRRERSVS